MEFERIEKKTLRQKVYEQLKEKMSTAEIMPGEQISLRDLAGKLGVSLMPVREALWQLESEKVVVIESNKKMWVNVLTPADIEEILSIRLPLETTAAEKACDLRPESILAEIEQVLSDMRDCVKMPKAYLKKNRQFHFGIYSLAQSPILLEIISGLWTRVGPYFCLATLDKKDVLTAISHHETMYRALAKRDKKKIAKALQDDLITGANGIIRFLETSGPNLAESRLG
jgi:DNA-binding GntR family transcriptional regulator